MNKSDIQELISSGEATAITIDPDVKTEISKKKIDGIVSDMKKHLSRRKKVHVVLIKE